MAEIINLFQTRIDYSEAQKSINELNKSLVTQKQKIDDVTARLQQTKKESKEAAKEQANGSEQAAFKYRLLTESVIALEKEQKQLRKDAAATTKEISNIENATQSIDAATGSIEEMRKEVAKLNAEWVKMSAAERNSTEGKAFTENLANKRQGLKDLEGAVGLHQRNVGNYESAIQNVLGRTNFGQNIIGQVQGIQEVASAIQGIITPMASVGTTAATTAASTGGLLTAFGGAGAAASATALGLAGIGVALVAVGGASAKFSADYKNDLIEIAKATDLPIEQLDKIVQKSTQIDLGGATINTAATDVAKLQATILSADATIVDMNGNIDENKLAIETQAAIMLAAADSTMTQKQAAEALTATMKQYNIDGSNAANVANLFAAGVNLGDQSITQSLEGLQKVAPAASGANVKLNESVALIQSLATVAGGSSEAGTQLSNVFTKLAGAMPIDGAAALKAALESTGGSYENLMNTSLPLEARLKELGKLQGQNAILAKAFEGSNLAVVNGLIKMANAADGTKESFSGAVEAVGKQGELQRQAALELEKSGAAWTNLGNRVQNALTSLAVANAIDTISGGIANALDGIIDFVVGFVGTFADAFTGLKDALQPLIGVIGSVFSSLSEAFGGMGGNIEIMQLLGRIVAEVVGRTILIPIRLLTMAINGIKWAFNEFSAGVTKVFDNLRKDSEVFRKIEDLLERATKKIREYLVMAKDFVKPLTQAFGSLFETTQKDGLKNIEQGTKQAGEAVKATAKSSTQYLNELKVALDATKQRYSALVSEGKQGTAEGKKLVQQALDLQKKIDEIEGIGKDKKDGSGGSKDKGKKEAEKAAQDSLAYWEKVVSELETKLKDTKMQTPAFDALFKSLQTAKVKLDEVKTAYTDLFKTDKERALEAAGTQKTARDESIKADSASGGDAQKVEKQRLLDSEIQYQTELLKIQKVGSKEYIAAETARKKALLDLQVETNKVRLASDLTDLKDGKTERELLIQQEAQTSKQLKDAEKLNLLLSEQEYQNRLMALYEQGTKEYKDAQLSLLKIDNDIAKERQAMKEKEQKEAYELDKSNLSSIVDFRTEQAEIAYMNEQNTEYQHRQRLLQIQIDYYTELAQNENASAEERAKNQKKADDLVRQSAKAAKDQTKKEFQQVVSNIKDVGGQILNVAKDFVQLETNERIGKIEEAKERELKAAGDNADKKAEIEEKYAAKLDEINKEQSEKQKAIATAQAIINGALAVTNILANTIDPTGVYKAILVAAAIATTVAQVATIQSQKFAKGGVIKGKSHAAGGVPMHVSNTGQSVELEGGEAVLSKQAVANDKARNIASFLNVTGGGVAFGSSLPNGVKTVLKSYISGSNFTPMPSPTNTILAGAGAAQIRIAQMQASAIQRESMILMQQNEMIQQNNVLLNQVIQRLEQGNTNTKGLLNKVSTQKRKLL